MTNLSVSKPQLWLYVPAFIGRNGWKFTKLLNFVRFFLIQERITGIRGVRVMLSFTTTFRYFSQKRALLMSPKGRNASRDGLVKLWGGGGLFIICNTITLWNNHFTRMNMHIKRVDCLYNSINQCMIRLWWSRAMFIEVRVSNRSRLL